MLKKLFRIIPALIALLIIVLSPSLQARELSSPSAPFVHLFEWKWNDIAQECEAYLGPVGYGAVQISPPNEHAVVAEKNFPWWQRYQPVSYKLTSRSGDRTELISMINRCHKAGVKIYADAVINHMAAVSDGVGSAGTVFSRYHYPDYTPEDFHTCRHGINNYGDRNEVINCELVGLPDLNTGSHKVRQQIANYLTSLLELGIDGFRIDAAKHIATEDIAAILDLVKHASNRPFVYQEVIDPGTEAIRKQEYYDNGHVLEFEYGKIIGETFLGVDGKNLAQLENLATDPRLMPSEKAVVFIDNHDKQRGHGGGGNYLTYKSELYDLANVFMLAYPYGLPQVMSSYDFSDSDQGPPADNQGHTENLYAGDRLNCFSTWICEHRRLKIASMVQFHNQVSDAPLNHWWVINRAEEPLAQTFQTNLSPGFYCNILTAGECSEEIKVNWRGQVTVTVDSMDAIAIHKGSKIRGR
jgi:alpha-amylase